MTNILCEKPKYILNPAFKDALLQTGKYVYNGNATCVPEMQLAAWSCQKHRHGVTVAVDGVKTILP